MKFTKLKYNILQKKFHKSLLKSVATRKISQKEIVSVGIISMEEITSNKSILEVFEEVLGVRNTKIYSYRKFNKENEFSYKHFSEADLNWKGEYIQENFKSFLEQPFDLLIGYFNQPNLYTENAVLHSQATFKVGFSKVNEALFDIEISEDANNVKLFASELKKYLQILKKL
ncbi:DUF6913 domain-containing protein [Polaribacter sp.]|uniref:DUF6913 domain-containing protein n=1 Tax=Polaribacter sp. TaxID=1920175 RepID=UPI003F6B88E4